MSSRAQIVLWHDEGYQKSEIATMSRPTVDKWLARYERFGLEGLVSMTSPGGPRQIPDRLSVADSRDSGFSPADEENLFRLPGQKVNVVLDNASVHLSGDTEKWLAKQNGEVVFHFTPTGASWMNQIEIWNGIIARKLIRQYSRTASFSVRLCRRQSSVAV